MNDRVARLAVLLGLIPAILGLVGSLLVAHDALTPVVSLLTPFVRDIYQFTILVSSTVIACVVVFLWRRYVLWTPIRSTATVAWTALLLGQVLLWCPIVSVQGCGKAESLAASQSATITGLWCMGCALTWWFFAFRRRGHSRPALPAGGKRMTPDVARIACGMALFPLLFGLWWMTGFLLTEFVIPQSEPWPEYLALELVSLISVLVWLLIWRSNVEWTRARRIVTLVLAIALLAAPAQLFLPRDFSPNGFAETLLRIVRTSTWFFVLGLWLMGTAWLWRSPRELTLRADAPPEIRCPQCDYRLTGLREVRCPECNWSSTVDEIARLTLAAAAT